MPIASSGGTNTCYYEQTAAGDECGDECATGKHLYLCYAGSLPRPEAGACAEVGDYAQGKRVCCAEKACTQYAACDEGRRAYTCPVGVSPPEGKCTTYPNTPNYHCCGDPAPGKCVDLDEPNDQLRHRQRRVPDRDRPQGLSPRAFHGAALRRPGRAVFSERKARSVRA